MLCILYQFSKVEGIVPESEKYEFTLGSFMSELQTRLVAQFDIAVIKLHKKRYGRRLFDSQAAGRH